MISALAMGIITGAVFGTALYKVAAINHSRVLGMLLLADLKIMKFAFAAVATATFAYGLAAVTGSAEALNLVPRVMPFTGWAHIVGGVIFGASMAITGWCPGVVVCRTTSRVRSFKGEGLLAIVGLFLGIAIFSMIKTPMFDAGILGAPKPLTLHGAFGLPYGPVALIIGTFFFILAGVLDSKGGEGQPNPVRPLNTPIERLRGEWHWLPSGIIGGLTIVWATYQDGFVGYSGSILATYGWMADAIGHPTSLVPTINDGIIWRVGLIAGVGLGGFLASLWSIKYNRAAMDSLSKDHGIDAKGGVRAVAGGAGLALGAMIGGGCTTGAFLAAFPTLSLGSFAMGGTFFAVGIVTSRVLNRLQPIELLTGAAENKAAA